MALEAQQDAQLQQHNLILLGTPQKEPYLAAALPWLTKVVCQMACGFLRNRRTVHSLFPQSAGIREPST